MWDAFFRLGQKDGEFLEISRVHFDRIMGRFFGNAPGTVLHKILKPVIAVVDSVAGTDLQNCGDCAERELRLNDLG